MVDRSALLLPLCRYLGLNRSTLSSFRDATLAASASVDPGSSIAPSSQAAFSQNCDSSTSNQACSPPSVLPGTNSKWMLGRQRLSFTPTSSLGLGIRSYAKKVEVSYVPLEEPMQDTYSTEPTNYVQLLGAIRKADDLGRLTHLLSAYSNKFDAVHLAAAISRLPRLLQFRPKDMQKTGVVAPKHSGLQGSAPLPGAKPRPSNTEEAGAILTKLKAMLPQHVSCFFPRQVCNSVWALGELHRLGVTDVSTLAAGTIITTTRPRKPPSKGKPPIKGIDTNEGALGLLLTSLKAKNYGLFKTHIQACEVAQLLKGLAQMSADNDLMLIKRLATFVQERSSEFSAAELHTVARAFASLKHADPELHLSIKQAIMQWDDEQSSTLTPQGIASLMTSFVISDPKGQHKELLGKLAEGVEPQAVLLTPKDITMIAYACAQQGFVSEGLLATLCKKSLVVLEKFSAEQITSLLDSLATLQYAGSRSLFGAVVDSVMAERDIDPKTTPKLVSRMMRAYVVSGFLGEHDSKARSMLDRLLLNAVEQQLKGATAFDLSVMCASLASMKSEQEELSPLDKEFMLMASGEAEQVVHQFNLYSLHTFLKSFNDLGMEGQLQLFIAAGAHMKKTLLPKTAPSRIALPIDCLKEFRLQEVIDSELCYEVQDLFLLYVDGQTDSSAVSPDQAVSLLRSCEFMGVIKPPLLRSIAAILEPAVRSKSVSIMSAAHALAIFAPRTQLPEPQASPEASGDSASASGSSTNATSSSSCAPTELVYALADLVSQGLGGLNNEELKDLIGLTEGMLRASLAPNLDKARLVELSRKCQEASEKAA